MSAARVAVFGGSFDPPHLGHQMAALYVLETQAVDQVLWVPCFRHPFAPAGPWRDAPTPAAPAKASLAPFVHRVAMCRLAIRALGERARVSEIEETLADGRTLCLLEELKRQQPEANLRLVVGADILAETSSWWRWSDIVKLAPPIVIGRAGYPSERAIELLAVSSSEIRARLSGGETVDDLLPASVLAYIAQQGLYR